MSAAPTHGGRELTVLTQNAWGGAGQWPRRRDMMARTIDRLRPDIIGLQEIHAPDACGDMSQAHELARLLGGYTAHFAPARIADSGACEGVALLCAHEVHERSVEALSLDEADRFDGKNQRVVLCSMLSLPEARVDVFVTHLSLSSRARARTLAELGAFVRAERARSGSVGAVLLGDMNAMPEEPALAAIEHAAGGPWIDAWKRVHGDARGGTWPVIWPRRRIDYIFFKPAAVWDVISCERIPFAGSDHLGVLAHLHLR